MRRLVPALLGALATTAAAQQAPTPANPDPAAVEAGTYRVDPNHTQVLFTVSHMGFSEYTGRFTGVGGSLRINPRQLATTRLDVTIPVDSVATTSEKLDGRLKSEQWLEAGRFGQMRFRSTKVTPTSAGRTRIGLIAPSSAPWCSTPREASSTSFRSTSS